MQAQILPHFIYYHIQIILSVFICLYVCLSAYSSISLSISYQFWWLQYPIKALFPRNVIHNQFLFIKTRRMRISICMVCWAELMLCWAELNQKVNCSYVCRAERNMSACRAKRKQGSYVLFLNTGKNISHTAQINTVGQ